MNQAVMLSSVSSQMPKQMNMPNSNSLGSLLEGEPKFGNMLSGLMLNMADVDEDMLELEGLELEELLNEFFHLIEEALVEPVVEPVVEPMTTEIDSEQEELVAYLTQLIKLFDETGDQKLTHPDTLTKNYEELYSLFQQMPTLLLENEKASSKIVALPILEKGISGVQAVAKWNVLLQALSQQDMEAKGLTSNTNSLDATLTSLEKGANQVPQLIASLLSKWQQDPEWLSFLKQKIHSESATGNILAEVLRTNPDHVPRFSTQLPMSLLLQAITGEQAEGKAIGLNESNAPLATNKSELSSQLALDPRTVPIEAKGTSAESKPIETPVPAARFAHLMEDLRGILKSQFQSLNQGESSQIRIKIFPEHLGHLDIRISSVAGKVSAEIMASHQMAKEALEVGLGQLRVALTQQGIQVDKIEVTQQNTTQSNTQSMLQDQKSGQQFFQNKEHGNGTTSNSSNSQFEEEEAMNSEFDEYGNNVPKIDYVV